MEWSTDQSPGVRAWTLACAQYDVIARAQLLYLGFHRRAIEHRLASGRLHPLFAGVYAVGRPTVSQRGMWMAAVLACGPYARLSHGSAVALMGIEGHAGNDIDVSIPSTARRRPRGIVVHRRAGRASEAITSYERIPVTPIVLTMIDLAAAASRAEIARAVNEADRLDLITPDTLRSELDAWPGVPGVRALRELLDESTFTATESELERMFLPIARTIGLGVPQTQQLVNGYRVDFFWPELGLVVETDGLRYHRTPEQQARDTIRTHAHLAAGLTPVRFTHAQIRYKPGYVRGQLASIVRRLRGIP
jgi:very-short-patch-repair endonuclease